MFMNYSFTFNLKNFNSLILYCIGTNIYGYVISRAQKFNYFKIRNIAFLQKHLKYIIKLKNVLYILVYILYLFAL